MSTSSAARRFLFSVDDLAAARGAERDLSFTGGGPDAFAAALQSALREPALWQQWLDRQKDPDEVDKALGATDPTAQVTAEQHDLRTDFTVVTTLSHAVLRHRLNLLIGPNWALQDVRAA